MTKTSKSVTCTVDCRVDSAFPFAVIMLVGSFDVPKKILFISNEFVLTYHVNM